MAIYPRFQDLKKAARKFSASPGFTWALLADTAPQFLATALEGTLALQGIEGRVWTADIGQIEASLSHSQSAMWEQSPQVVVIYQDDTCWRERFYNARDRTHFAEGEINKLRQWARQAAAHQVQVIYLIPRAIDDRVFGHYGLAVAESLTYQQKYFQGQLLEIAREFPDWKLVDWDNMASTVGYLNSRSQAMAIQADLQMDLELLPELAHTLVKVAMVQKGHFHKCLILDLDHTLWGGVVGDDGWEQLELGELGIGRAYSQLQYWFRELKRRGIILALASKNNEATAREAFEKHPDMLLEWEDFAVRQVNWDNKVKNIQRIQQVLNIAYDSMVFVDDNPFERAMVAEQLPEVTVPELPEDPAEYLSHLQRLDLFETASYSSLDHQRTEQYQREAARLQQRELYEDETDFLDSLDMRAYAEGLTAYNRPRAAQLSQRSNQFNLRTIRFSEEELRQWDEKEGQEVLNFYLRDRFGKHGLIAVVFWERMEDRQAWFITNWIMSCRVLKRGMEAFTLNYLMRVLQQGRGGHLRAEYLPTAKNALVQDLLPSLGFQPLKNNQWELSAQDFTPLGTTIQYDTDHE